MIEEREDPDTFEFESPEFEWAKKLKSKIEVSSKQIEHSLREITALKKVIEERIGTRVDILQSKMEEQREDLKRGLEKQKEDLKRGLEKQKEDLRDNIRRLHSEMDKLRRELQAASVTTPSDLKAGDSGMLRLIPPQYDGNYPHLLQFKAAANANGWLHGEKATALTLALRHTHTQTRGVIVQSMSPWSLPVALEKKKHELTRFCVDYRQLNNVTKKESYPLPKIDDTLDTLAGSRVFSTLDLKSGYWQIEMDPGDKGKTAFTVGSGLW
nr:unnamed protein product [Callosobruchus analis]